MAIFTKLSRDEIKSILKHFPDAPTSSFHAKGIALGTVNTYYRLTFQTREVLYLKIDEVADKKRLQNEILIFENLSAQKNKLSHQTPTPLRTHKNKKFILFQNKFALLIPELKGTSYFGKDLTPKHLEIIGQNIAQWHKLKANSKIKRHRFDLNGQKKVFAQIKKPLAEKHPELSKWIAEKLNELTQQTPKNLPLTLIHADLFPENIMWQKNKLTGILDLDAAGLGEALFDIGVCLHALCHDGQRFDLAKIKCFFKGYFQVRPLNAKEKQSFAYFLELSAMRFLLTRLRDFELAPAGRKVKPFKDFRQYERRFTEISSLNIDLS